MQKTTFVEFFLREENSNSPSTCDGVTWVDCVATTTAYYTGGKTKGGEWTDQRCLWNRGIIAFTKNTPAQELPAKWNCTHQFPDVSLVFRSERQTTAHTGPCKSWPSGLFIWLWIGKKRGEIMLWTTRHLGAWLTACPNNCPSAHQWPPHHHWVRLATNTTQALPR